MDGASVVHYASMPIRMNGLQMEKQAGAELCWAAAALCVLGYYGLRGGRTQADLRDEFNDEDKEAGDPEPVLAAANAHDYSIRLDGDDEAVSRCADITVRIGRALNSGNPVILAIRNSNGSFRHALVVREIDLISRSVVLADPSVPNVNLRGNLADMLIGSWDYVSAVRSAGNAPQGGQFAVYLYRVIFSKRPNQNATPLLDQAPKRLF